MELQKISPALVTSGVELNEISFSCAGSPRISIIDGEVGDSQPIVRRDLLVELANEEQRFEFREDLENDDWRVHIFTDSCRFQNTARRFAKFPRTKAAPPFVVIVVEKECCTQILGTVNR